MTKVVIVGGGTFNSISCHLSLAAPAFGSTARQLKTLYEGHGVEVDLILTKMADHTSRIVTNKDLWDRMLTVSEDPEVDILVMNAAICDFYAENPSEESRLSSSKEYPVTLVGIQGKILKWFKERRPDVTVVGFKTTEGAQWTTQLSKAALSLESNGIDIVLANDVGTKKNLVITSNGDFVQADRLYCLNYLVSESLDLAE